MPILAVYYGCDIAKNFVLTMKAAIKNLILRKKKMNLCKFGVIFFSIFIWSALFPGYYSDDSINTMHDLKIGQFHGIQGTIWNLYVYIFTLFGKEPTILSLLSLLVLNFSIRFFCSEFLITKIHLKTWIIILFPATWTFGLTIWHDVPFTSGLLLSITVIKKSNFFRKKLSFQSYSILLFGNFLILTRMNGLLFSCTILILLIRKVTIQENRATVMYLILLLILQCVPVFNLVAGQERHQFQSGQYFMRADLSCLSATEPRIMEKIFKKDQLEKWKSRSACNWFNDSIVETENLATDSRAINVIYLRTLKEAPIDILIVHWKRNGYLIDPVIALKEPAPFLHTDNDWNSEKGALGEKVYQFFNIVSRSNNFFRGILANHAIVFIFLLVLYLRGKKHALIPTFLSALLCTTNFVIAPHPDSRFVYITILFGYVFVVDFIVDSLSRKKPKNLFFESNFK